MSGSGAAAEAEDATVAGAGEEAEVGTTSGAEGKRRKVGLFENEISRNRWLKSVAGTQSVASISKIIEMPPRHIGNQSLLHRKSLSHGFLEAPEGDHASST